MKKNLFKLAVVLGLVSVLVLPSIALATVTPFTIGEGFAEESGLPSEELPITVARIINAALGLLGLVAVVIILIGGFKWMTAMGNEDSVKKAKQLIIQGVIGLIIVVCAYAIASFVLSAVNKAAGLE